MIALCHTRQQAERVKARMAGWLAPRGLSFNEAKTTIVTLEAGYRLPRVHSAPLPSRQAAHQAEQGRCQDGSSTRLAARDARPARAATRRPSSRRSTRSCGDGRTTTGERWSSKKTFAALDHYLWQLTYKWACHSHANKPKPWIVSRYYGRFNPASQNRWVFGNRDNGAYLPRLGWTKIIRHSLVVGAGVSGRPRPDRLLGPATRQERTPARPQRPDPARQAERPLPPVQGPALARRPRATSPTEMGTVAPNHPQSDHQAVRDHPAGHGHSRAAPVSVHTPLPAPGNRRRKTRNQHLSTWTAL